MERAITTLIRVAIQGNGVRCDWKSLFEISKIRPSGLDPESRMLSGLRLSPE
jgi:hypothetical protein